jgi:high-affinity nickel permease
MLHRGERPLGVGFFFSIGHSTVVLVLAAATVPVALVIGIIELLQMAVRLWQLRGPFWDFVAGLGFGSLGLGIVQCSASSDRHVGIQAGRSRCGVCESADKITGMPPRPELLFPGFRPMRR